MLDWRKSRFIPGDGGASPAMKLDVQAYLQTAGHDCGASAVYMVLRRHGVRISYADVLAGLAVNELDGVGPDAIEQYLRHQGLKVLAGEMTLADLLSNIRQGRPIIVPTSDGGGHWQVVTGLVGNVVHLNDPAVGATTRLRSKFLTTWKDWTRRGVEYSSWGIAAWK